MQNSIFTFMLVSQTILCVDDDQDDRYLFGSSLKKMAPHLDMAEVNNGLEALKFLQRAKEAGTLPCLVVLDINMPLMDGRQTLEKIRMDDGLKDLTIVVFTSSKNPRDKIFFNNMGVELVVKPFDYRQFEPVINNFVKACSPL